MGMRAVNHTPDSWTILARGTAVLAVAVVVVVADVSGLCVDSGRGRGSGRGMGGIESSSRGDTMLLGALVKRSKVRHGALSPTP